MKKYKIKISLSDKEIERYVFTNDVYDDLYGLCRDDNQASYYDIDEIFFVLYSLSYRSWIIKIFDDIVVTLVDDDDELIVVTERIKYLFNFIHKTFDYSTLYHGNMTYMRKALSCRYLIIDSEISSYINELSDNKIQYVDNILLFSDVDDLIKIRMYSNKKIIDMRILKEI